MSPPMTSNTQREVILLVGLEGMSYEAAAQILEVPVGTVRSRLSRGRDALRQLMDMPERTRTPNRFARGRLRLAHQHPSRRAAGWTFGYPWCSHSLY
jgi:transposase